MTKEDKQLLLKDLCSRLPYHPIVHVEHNICGIIEIADLQVYGYEEGKLKLLREDNETFCYIPIEECRPYLRPMDSMTEEEKEEFRNIINEECSCDGIHLIGNEGGYIVHYSWMNKCVDWLNKKGFDYHRLIPKGLAIDPSKICINN